MNARAIKSKSKNRSVSKRWASFFSYSAFTSIAIIGLVSCSEDTFKRKVHEAPRSTSMPGLDADDAKVKSTKTDSALRTSSPSLSGLTEDSPILDEVLNSARLQDKKIATSQQMKDRLQTLNSAILTLAEKKSPHLEAILARYEATALEGCDTNLKGCRRVGFFAQDPLSADVIALLVEKETDLQRYYRLLLFGFDVHNHSPQDGLMRLYLARMKEWIQSLSNSTNTDLLARHQKIMGVVLNRQRVLLKDGSGLPQWLIDLNPLLISRRTPSPLHEYMTLLMELTLRLVDKNDPAALSTLLKNSNEWTVSDPDSTTRVESRVPKKILEALQASSVLEKDEYFFILDRLYLGHFSASDALAIWQNTKQDGTKLSAQAKAYVRLRMADMIHASNLHMSTLLKDESKQSNVVQRAIDQSFELNERWAEFLRSVSVIRDFTKQAIRLDHPSPEAEIAINDLLSFFDGLSDTIRVSVTYPHMMVMIYNLSRTKYVDTITTFSGVVEINPSMIIEKFFRGPMAPWFKYTPDRRPLSSSEIPYAFEFALRTGVFETFGIDVSDFLAAVFDNLLGPKLTSLRSDFLLLKQKYEETDEWGGLLRLCKAMQNNQTYENSVNLTELSISPLLGKRFNKLLSVSDRTEADSKGAIRGYYTYSSKLLNTLEGIRLDLDPNLFGFHSMIESTASFLALTGSDAASITARLNAVREKEKSARSLRDDFIKLILLRHSEFSRCAFPLFAKEKQVQIDLIKAETEHLRQIYRDMNRLALHPDEHEPLNAKYRFRNLPAGFQGFSSFDAETYNYSHLDLLLRMKSYLEKGLVTESVTLPAIDTHTKVEVLNNLAELYIYRGNRITQIPRAATEEEFINAGLKTMQERNRDGDRLFWFTESRYRSYQMRYWVHALAILYRLDPIASLEASKPMVAPSELVETPFKILDLFNIQGEEFAMKAIHSETRAAEDSLFDLFVHRHTREPLPPLNLSYTYLALDYLGTSANDGSFAYKDVPAEVSARPVTYLPIREKATEFARYLSARAKYSFDVVSAVDTRLREYHAARVRTDRNRVEEFEKEADRRRNEDRSDGALFVNHLNRSRTYTYQEYLAPVLKMQMRSTLEDLQGNSDHLFDQR